MSKHPLGHVQRNTRVTIRGETVIAIIRLHKWRKRGKNFNKPEVVVFT